MLDTHGKVILVKGRMDFNNTRKHMYDIKCLIHIGRQRLSFWLKAGCPSIPPKCICSKKRCKKKRHWNSCRCGCSLYITLPMLRPLLSKPQGHKYFWKSSKPCHVGIHLKALAGCSLMSTYMPGFQSFFRFFASFVLAKLATSSIRVKEFLDTLMNVEVVVMVKGRTYLYTNRVHMFDIKRVENRHWISCQSGYSFYLRNSLIPTGRQRHLGQRQNVSLPPECICLTSKSKSLDSLLMQLQLLLEELLDVHGKVEYVCLGQRQDISLPPECICLISKGLKKKSLYFLYSLYLRKSLMSMGRRSMSVLGKGRMYL